MLAFDQRRRAGIRDFGYSVWSIRRFGEQSEGQKRVVVSVVGQSRGYCRPIQRTLDGKDCGSVTYFCIDSESLELDFLYLALQY